MPAPQTRRILGIDPGTRVAGWGVIERRGNALHLVAHGTVRTRGPTMAQRLLEVHDGLRAAIAEHAPDALAVETPYVGKSPTAALAVGMARGIALLLAAANGLPIDEYPPAIVKKAVVGNGNASKEQVAEMVRVLLGLQEAPKPADVTDALAIALAHAHRSRFDAAVRAVPRSGTARHRSRGRAKST